MSLSAHCRSPPGDAPVRSRIPTIWSEVPPQRTENLMQATTPGMNRTGATASPIGSQAMLEAVEQFSPMMPIDTSEAKAERARYINEADPVGSIPIPASMKGMVKTGMAKLKGGHPSIFLDK